MDGIYPEGEVDLARYNIDLQLLLETTADPAAVLLALQELLQMSVAPELSQCTGLEANRRLQVEAILGAAFFPVEDADSALVCETDLEGNCLNVDVETIVYYAKDGDPSTFGQIVYDEVVKHCESIANIEGVISVFDPCLTILLTPVNDPNGTLGGPIGPGKAEPDPDIAGVARVSAEEDDGMGVGGILGITLAGVVLVLLFMLLAVRRKRRDEYNLKHHTLVEVTDSDTYLQETDETSARNVHIVGETDSVFSGWTGYSSASRFNNNNTIRGSDQGSGNYGDEHLDRQSPTQNVHQCSSATCEVCEHQRQQGLQFLPTMPSHSHDVLLRTDTRDYLATDTVEL